MKIYISCSVVLSIAETKKREVEKKAQLLISEDGHAMIKYEYPKINMQVDEQDALPIHKYLAKHTNKWEGVSERILTIE